MSENVEICRVCLVADVQMVKIAGTSLQLVYEKLTNSPLHHDSLPVAACYMCCARLCKSRALIETATRATHALSELLATNKITKTTISQISHSINKICGALAVSKTKYVDVDIDATVPAVSINRASSVGMETSAAPVDVKPTVLAMDVKAFEPANDVHGTVPAINIDRASSVGMEISEAPVDVKPTVLPIYSKSSYPANDVHTTVPAININRASSVGMETSEAPVDVKATVPVVDMKPSTPGNNVHATEPVEIEFERNWAKDIKVEVKEESLDLDEKCPLDMTNKDGEDSSTNDDNDDEISLRNLGEQQRGVETVVKETVQDGDPAHTIGLKEPKTTSKPRKYTRRKTGKGPHNCDVYKKQFTDSDVLRGHLRHHTGDISFKCDICQLQFRTKPDYILHMRSHTGDQLHHCHLCQNVFTSTTDLKKHLKEHGDVYKCDFCSLPFSEKSSLEEHLKFHTGEDLHECTICRKRFKYKYHMTAHMKIHSEKAFECSICTRRFSRKLHLEAHLRIKHTRKKAHECRLCHRKFGDLGDLKKHTKTHIGEVLSVAAAAIKPLDH